VRFSKCSRPETSIRAAYDCEREFYSSVRAEWAYGTLTALVSEMNSKELAAEIVESLGISFVTEAPQSGTDVGEARTDVRETVLGHT